MRIEASDLLQKKDLIQLHIMKNGLNKFFPFLIKRYK